MGKLILFLLLLWVVLCVIFSVFCFAFKIDVDSWTREVTKEEKIDNIIRVFWHEGDRYSVFIEEPGIKEVRVRELCYRRHTNNFKGIHIYKDVPQDRPMWACLVTDGNQRALIRLDIHVHSESDINGGGWVHQYRIGHRWVQYFGQTQVIE